jgi:hypothetical protein
MITDDKTRVRVPGSTGDWPAPSRPVECRAQPLDALALDRDPVDAAGRRRPQAEQEMLRGEDESASLGRSDARCRTPWEGTAAGPQPDEHERAVAFAHDQVDLAAARTGAPRATR